MAKARGTRKSKAVGTAVKIGAGIAIAAAAVAGAYWLYGKNGVKNRKKVKGWALKMKGEILEKMEQAPELTRALYEGTIDQVSKNYKPLMHVDKDELAATIKDLKGAWGHIKKQLEPKRKTARKTASKKAPRVATRKTAKPRKTTASRRTGKKRK